MRNLLIKRPQTHINRAQRPFNIMQLMRWLVMRLVHQSLADRLQKTFYYLRADFRGLDAHVFNSSYSRLSFALALNCSAVR